MSNLRLVSLGTLCSRLLGLLRDMGMASLFGTGTIFDAFVVAFRIPNLARQLLGEGALNTAFLPVFLRCRMGQGDQAARETLTQVALILMATLTAGVLLSEAAIWGVWHLVDLLPPTRLLLLLLAILLPYAILICEVALLCSVLQALRQFLWPAVLPVVLNVIWLTGLLIVGPLTLENEARAVWMAVCVTLAGVVQLLLATWAVQRSGMGLVWKFPGRHWGEVRELVRAMLPVLVGMSLLQASAILDSLLAWGLARSDQGAAAWCEAWGIPPLVEAGTASALYIGQRMYQFPLGVFGIALGTVLYPVLTQHAQQGEHAQLCAVLSRGIRIVIAVGIPASVGLCLVAWPLTLGLFRRGEFSEANAVFTSRMILVYGSGVWSFIGIAILNRAWYAIDDRLTPLRLGLVFLALQQVLNLTLVCFVQGIGLAMGSVLANAGLCLTSLWLLHLRLHGLDWPAIRTALVKGLLATACMTLACLAASATFQALPGQTSALGHLLALCLCGAGSYLMAARVLRMGELDELLRKKS